MGLISSRGIIRPNPLKTGSNGHSPKFAQELTQRVQVLKANVNLNSKAE